MSDDAFLERFRWVNRAFSLMALVCLVLAVTAILSVALPADASGVVFDLRSSAQFVCGLH